MKPIIVREDKTEEFFEKCGLSALSKERRQELMEHSKSIRKKDKKEKEKMWLVNLGDIIVNDNGTDVDITYRLFGDKYFLYSSNKIAVDTIRKMLELKGFHERWIDVAFDEDHIEYVTYLFFATEEYEVGVWFNYHEVDKAINIQN